MVIFASEGAGNGLWLVHDTNEIIWGSIAFCVVAFALYRKAWPAIRKSMVGRTQRIQDEMDAATKLRTDAEAERDSIREALADSESEASRILAEAHETATKLRADLSARADLSIASLRERGANDLEAARRQAESDLRVEISKLALGAAEQVVHHNLDSTTQQSLIESYIAQAGASN